MASRPARERALARAKQRPLMAGREIAVHGQNLTRLVREGALERYHITTLDLAYQSGAVLDASGNDHRFRGSYFFEEDGMPRERAMQDVFFMKHR